MQGSFFYILYSPKYLIDPDNAPILSTANTLKEARQEKKEDWPDAIIVRAYTNKGEIIDQEIVD